VSAQAGLAPIGRGGRTVGCVQVRIGQIGGMSVELAHDGTTSPSTHTHAQPA
jgi:hypothetical protein